MSARLPLVTAALALVLTGAAASASLPGVSTAGDRAAWHALLHWPANCERGWKATGEPGAGMELMPAGGGRDLVAVESATPGAYQGDALLYLALTSPAGSRSDRSASRSTPRRPGNGHPKLTASTTILGVLDFTKSTGTLTVFDKFRGLGDCGIFTTYRLEGSRLVLTAARAKHDLLRRRRRRSRPRSGRSYPCSGTGAAAVSPEPEGCPLCHSAWSAFAVLLLAAHPAGARAPRTAIRTPASASATSSGAL